MHLSQKPAPPQLLAIVQYHRLPPGHNAHDGYFGARATASLERGGARGDRAGVIGAGRGGCRVRAAVRCVDQLIYQWRRNPQQSETRFVPAVMAEDEGSVAAALSEDGRADRAAIRLDLAGGTTVSISATAPARLVLAVLWALR